MTVTRYIWICGPSACGKSTLCCDAAKLERILDIHPPYIVRESCHNTSVDTLTRIENLIGIPVDTVVQVWQWRTHGDMLTLIAQLPKQVEVVLIKPYLRDWRRWHQEKYHPIAASELTARWERVERRLQDSVPKYRVLQLNKEKIK